MYSHIVIFWTKSDVPGAAQLVREGADKYLRSIPGLVSFHAGLMVPTPRAVVDQSYQVALNVIYTDQQAHDEYQQHPMHLQFVREFSPLWEKVLVYDFQ